MKARRRTGGGYISSQSQHADPRLALRRSSAGRSAARVRGRTSPPRAGRCYSRRRRVSRGVQLQSLWKIHIAAVS